MANDDDERDDSDDDDEVAVKKPVVKAAARSAAKPHVDENLALLREIRDLVRESRDRQDRYLWMLLPVIAILLVMAIFQAVKL